MRAGKPNRGREHENVGKRRNRDARVEDRADRSIRCSSPSTGTSGDSSRASIRREAAAMVSGRLARINGEPDDIAAIAVFLAADESGMLTGTTIAADGGRSSYLKACVPEDRGPGSARPSVNQLGLRRLKNMAMVPGIGQATLICLISRGRFRDDCPVRGQALPFPAPVGIQIKTPDEVHFCILPRFGHAPGGRRTDAESRLAAMPIPVRPSSDSRPRSCRSGP